MLLALLSPSLLIAQIFVLFYLVLSSYIHVVRKWVIPIFTFLVERESPNVEIVYATAHDYVLALLFIRRRSILVFRDDHDEISVSVSRETILNENLRAPLHIIELN